jgi:hypothetical protein
VASAATARDALAAATEMACAHRPALQLIRFQRALIATHLEVTPSQDEHPKEPTMNRHIDTLIQRSTALTLALVVTLAVLAGIDGLASRDVAADALLSQQAAQAAQA